MSELLQKLTRSCFADRDALDSARTQAALWQTWLLPVTADTPVGEDPGYHDDFLRIRDEMNKLSGADTDLICQLAESLLLTQAKDVRIATYYIWARLHRDGERGLAEGLALLAGLVERFGAQLLPSRPASRKMALEWLAGEKMLDSLARYPEVAKEDFANIVAALNQLTVSFTAWPEDQHSPSLMPLINALESRLAQSGGMNAVVPQNSSGVPGTVFPGGCATGTDHHFRARPARPGESAGPLSERTAAGLAFSTPADENPALGHGA